MSDLRVFVTEPTGRMLWTNPSLEALTAGPTGHGSPMSSCGTKARGSPRARMFDRGPIGIEPKPPRGTILHVVFPVADRSSALNATPVAADPRLGPPPGSLDPAGRRRGHPAVDRCADPGACRVRGDPSRVRTAGPGRDVHPARFSVVVLDETMPDKPYPMSSLIAAVNAVVARPTS